MKKSDMKFKVREVTTREECLINDHNCYGCNDYDYCNPDEVKSLLWIESSTRLSTFTPVDLRADEAESQVVDRLYPKYQRYVGEEWAKEINTTLLLEKFPTNKIS